MSKLHITTTQNVPLFFTPASVGERILAGFIDLLIKYAYVVIAYLIFFTGMNIFNVIQEQNWGVIVIMLIILLPYFFYSIACESLMEGQTFGKKLTKIRVVKIDGYQAGFFDFFLRWIFRLVDVEMAYLPGLITMMATKHTQRLGDLAAGTAVITEKSKYNISHTILMDVEETYKPYFAQNQILLFSDNDIRIIRENANVALKQNNFDLMTRLTRRVENVMNVTNTFPSQREFISTLIKDYNHYTGK